MNVSTKLSKSLAVVGAMSLFSTSTLAALPTVAPPSRGASGGNFITDLQNYGYDIALFAGLAISAILFFIVAKNIMVTYSNVSDGKATMGNVGMQAGIGVLLLVVVIYLVSQASQVL